MCIFINRIKKFFKYFVIFSVFIIKFLELLYSFDFFVFNFFFNIFFYYFVFSIFKSFIFFDNILNFFSDSKDEVSSIVWPNFMDILRFLVIIIILSFLFSLIIWCFDLVIFYILRVISF